ncbi:MAG: AAA family ATPase [Psychrosphaera sp.]|nr:AAA family ATPase [Psychrosphaera sp.]
MIRKFGVKNFFCFKEGVDINFGFDGNVPETISQGRDFSTIIGIKGSNGSGKTNIIKAIQFLRSFCYFASDSNNEDRLAINGYYDSTDPSEFYIDFEVDDVKYYYELDVTANGVLREVLYRTPIRETKARKTKILERQGDAVVEAIEELSELKLLRLKNNASIISLVRKYNFRADMTDLHRIAQFFFKFISNVDFFGYRNIDLGYEVIAKEYNQDPALFKFVKDIVRSADDGIDDIVIKSRLDENGNEVFYPLFIHQHNGKNYALRIGDESSGTRVLFQRMHMYWIVLSTGGLLALDEFDIHIHAMILPKILALFTNPESNPHNAQFIFTAHNTEIIDTLGKYRTILVNKEDNESYCYRLDEIPGSMIRNDRTIVPLYLQGKIGGVPGDEVL